MFCIITMSLKCSHSLQICEAATWVNQGSTAPIRARKIEGTPYTLSRHQVLPKKKKYEKQEIGRLLAMDVIEPGPDRMGNTDLVCAKRRMGPLASVSNTET